MWFGVQISVAVMTGWLVWRSFRGFRRDYGYIDTGLFFLVCAIWLRCVAALFHSTTYQPVLGGMSLNALLSIGTVFGGLAILQARFLLATVFLPVWLLLATMLLSALINEELGGFVAHFFKWAYFVVIAAHAWRAIELFDRGSVLSILITALSVPLIAQVFSILLGEMKASEADGSQSFIGGFNHESTFSILLVTSLVLLAHLPRATVARSVYRTPLAVIVAFGIILANYRTSLLAAAPILAVISISRSVERWHTKSQGAIALLAVLFVAILALLAAEHFQERFLDLFSGSEAIALIFAAPESFTNTQQDLFSARVFLWSQYLTEWMAGGPSVWLLGFGPEAWVGQISKYAHNSFISQLYEGGLAGAIALVMVFLMNLVLSARVAIRHGEFTTLMSQLGFLTLNFATMPLWQIEGIIFFALLSALTWSRALAGDSPTSSSASNSAEGGVPAHRIIQLQSRRQVASARTGNP